MTRSALRMIQVLYEIFVIMNQKRKKKLKVIMKVLLSVLGLLVLAFMGLIVYARYFYSMAFLKW